MGVLRKIFGTASDRELRKMQPVIAKILSYEDQYKALDEDSLKQKTAEFRDRLSHGRTEEEILPEAFAAVREAASRTVGMRHYPVQLMGGIALHHAQIAELKTGEGKTLVATAPAYLNALSGKGVHIVTVNDYLAGRDAEWMGQVYRFLGLTVGVVLHDSTAAARKAAYDADITYVTNSELGFDYLRDNMAAYKSQQVLRGLHYCIVDEVDSILIDEARTPLIISGQGRTSTSLYSAADFFVHTLEKGEASAEFSKRNALLGDVITETGDFVVDEKEKTATLTEQGTHKAEQFFHVDNLAAPENLDLQHHISIALKANWLMHKDKDYVVRVRDGEVLIVDEFTGRVQPGRRYSDGLHQAIEAKEKVDIKQESKTLATITYQNFFNKYEKKSGMTGTAASEAKEFANTYALAVITVPTNRPVIRKDLPDLVFKTKEEKYNAVVEETVRTHATGQPVLIGTNTIEVSEQLSKKLTDAGVPHTVLNAKNDAVEAEIVAHAGELGAVTIATNMAGRGTDIKLDAKAKEIGGLKIIGTERNEARRIDNQLIGRSGRQGDPGSSQFYLSAEDDILKHYGSDRLKKLIESADVPDGKPMESKMLSRLVRMAQERIENNSFGVRDSLLKYDMVNNEQRELVYAEREKILNGENMRDTIYGMMDRMIDGAVSKYAKEGKPVAEWDTQELANTLFRTIPLTLTLTPQEFASITEKQFAEEVKTQAKALYEARIRMSGLPEAFSDAERSVSLRCIDQAWTRHIDDMAKLQEGIGLSAYGQKDPAVEYRIRGYEMFDRMLEEIGKNIVYAMFHIRFEVKPEEEETGASMPAEPGEMEAMAAKDPEQAGGMKPEGTPVLRTKDLTKNILVVSSEKMKEISEGLRKGTLKLPEGTTFRVRKEVG